MNIKIVAVGKMREAGFKSAFDEYSKRLAPYCTFSCIEIPAVSIKDDSLATKYKEDEAAKILGQIKPGSFVVALEITGKTLTSEEFSQKIQQISNEGVNEVIFVIGGANGLANSVLSRSDFKLSFSKMTFPHQLARVMLTEQIYRAMKILAKEPYHK